MNKFAAICKFAPTLALGATLLAPALASPKIPANVVGKWAMTSISGTTYWDASTGAYKGSGNGGSQTYTFDKNGKYKFFNYVKTIPTAGKCKC